MAQLPHSQQYPTYSKVIRDLIENEDMNILQANQDPRAQRAYKQDEDNYHKMLVGQAADKFSFTDERTGLKITSFPDQESMKAAFSNPLYKQSAGYREAVARIAENTPDHIMGIRAVENADSLAQPATVESMLQHAQEEALVEALASKEYSSKTAQGRLNRMTALSDPNVVKIVDKLQGTDKRPVENYMKEQQRQGIASQSVQVIPTIPGSVKPSPSEAWTVGETTAE